MRNVCPGNALIFMFYTRLAYSMMFEDDTMAKESIWELVWNRLGPNRGRFFLWIVFRRGLPMNKYSNRCGFSGCYGSVGVFYQC